MSLIATSKSQQNSTTLDPWTLVHFSAGLAMGLMEAPFWPSMIAATAYEFVEHEFEDSEFGQRFFNISGPEIMSNAVVDVIIFGVGWYAGKKWNQT